MDDTDVVVASTAEVTDKSIANDLGSSRPSASTSLSPATSELAIGSTCDTSVTNHQEWRVQKSHLLSTLLDLFA